MNVNTFIKTETTTMADYDVEVNIQGVPKKKLTIINGYNFFDIYGR